MQKNFRKVPDYIVRKIEESRSPYLIVATTLRITEAQIRQGEWKHLGIVIDSENNVTITDVIQPNELHGRYAKKNRDGYDIVHKEQPKIRKEYSWDVPNFGDPSKGYHEVVMTRLVYPRTHVAPREWSLDIELLREEVDVSSRVFIVKVSVDVVLNKEDRNTFNANLFFAINLLQENALSCDVFESDTTKEEFLKTQVVGWEVFPVGSLNRAIQYASSQIRKLTDADVRQIQSRATFLNSLSPLEFVVGKGLNRRYFGAKFSENLVVFENVTYGNATYILFDNWKEISQMSRIDILQRKEKDFIRLIHRQGWEQALKHHVEKLRFK